MTQLELGDLYDATVTMEATRNDHTSWRRVSMTVRGLSAEDAMSRAYALLRDAIAPAAPSKGDE